MGDIPVIGFAAYSGSGKTTLIEKLLPVLKQSGIMLAVIKHDGHDFEIDHEGKDSRRFTQAGADITLINSAHKTACIERRGYSLQEMLCKIHGVDLILVEGFKNEPIPRIGIARKAAGKGFTADISSFIAVVTDLETEFAVPRFGFDDIEPLAQFILDTAGLAPRRADR